MDKPKLPSELVRQAATMTHRIQGEQFMHGDRLYRYLLEELRLAEKRGASGVDLPDGAKNG